MGWLGGWAGLRGADGNGVAGNIGGYGFVPRNLGRGGGGLQLAALVEEITDETGLGAVQTGLEAIEVLGAGAVGDVEVAVGEALGGGALAGDSAGCLVQQLGFDDVGAAH